MNNNYKQSKIREKKGSETIKDQKEEQLDTISDQEGVSIDDKNRVKIKSMFEAIAEVSKNKNAKEEAERPENLDKTIMYDKLSITDKNSGQIIGLTKYIALDLFARRIFYGNISLKEAEKLQDKMESEIKKIRKVQSKDTREKRLTKNNS